MKTAIQIKLLTKILHPYIVEPKEKLIIALVKYNLGLVVLVDPGRFYGKVLVSKF